MANSRRPAADRVARADSTDWESPLRDFFISFNQADKRWADWIVWVLAEAGYDLFYQHRDFGPGSNFMVEMQRALLHAEQTILVLSDAAIRSDFVFLEWTTTLRADPTGAQRKLVPVRVRPLTLPLGMLGGIVYVDLVDLGPSDARNALLGAFGQPSRPSTRPPPPKPPFPGSDAEVNLSRLLRKRRSEIEQRQDADQAPAVDRRTLTESLSKVGVRHFNILLEVLEVPLGVVDPMPAEQDERIPALLDWAGERTGLGMVASLTEVLRQAPGAAVALDQQRPSELAVAAVASCDGVLEEIDELGRAYMEVELWPKAFYTYRTLVDLAAEENTQFYALGLARLGEVHWLYGEPANAWRSWGLSRAVYGRLGRDPKAKKEADSMAKRRQALIFRLTDVPGIGAATAKTLAEAGIRDVISLAEAQREELVAVRGFSPARAAAVRKAVRALLTTSEATLKRAAKQGQSKPRS